MPRTLPRQRIEAWLRLDKPAECDLLNTIIPDLKAQRAYSAAIRDGLRIIWELRQGQTDHLLKVFPFLRQALQVPSPTVAPHADWPPAQVRSIENEAEHQRRSIENTLAAIEEF